MNVIYDVITEDTLQYFNADVYGHLTKLVNDVISIQVQHYLKQPNANPKIRADVEKYLGPLTSSYVFHKELAERGILDMLRTLAPETILYNSPEYLKDVREKLQFLRDNQHRVRTILPARSLQDWNAFAVMLQDVGVPFEMYDYIVNNRHIFYTPKEKERRLPSAYVISVQSRWNMALNAILYDDYCKSAGVPNGVEARSRFM